MKQLILKELYLFSRILVILVFCLQETACSKGIQPALSPFVDDSNVTITFAGEEYNRSFYNPLMTEFHKQNPSISVQFVTLPPSGSGYATTADYYHSQASAADTSIVSAGGGELGLYFKDLSPRIEADSTFKLDDFWPDALTGCQDEDGRTFGAPVSLSMVGIFYDEQAFAAAGLDTPKPGWTWDDFRRDAVALASQPSGKARYGYAEQPSSPYYSLLAPFLNASLVASGGQIDLQALAGGSQWYLDMAKAGVLYPITGVDPTQQAKDQWTALFATEGNRPAMWSGNLVNSVLGSGAISGSALSVYHFVPFPVPVDGSNLKTTPIATNCAVVSNASTHPAEAWTCQFSAPPLARQ